jgi:hypothetical protein
MAFWCRRPGGCASIVTSGFVLSALLLPCSCVIFGMRSHGPNIHTTAVITNSCHQTGSIPANIEHRELPHVICGGENRPKFHKQSEVAAFHLSVPVFQSTAGFRVSSSKLVQPLPRMICTSLHSLKKDLSTLISASSADDLGISRARLLCVGCMPWLG